MGRLPLVVISLALSGCPLEDEGVSRTPDLGPGAQAGWALRPHPCPGRTTEALFRDADGAIYTGCGTGADGRGLWRTRNEGVTWAPVGGLETWRINDVDPAPDGGLFVAGIDTESRVTVAHLSPEGALSPVYTRGVQVSESFHVGHFERLDSGAAIAESLTGGALVYRSRDEALFRGIDRWSTDEVGHQILSLTSDGEAFYAVGSTISEPPTVFLPVANGINGDHLFMPVLPLGDGVRGELWAVAQDGGRLLAAGVNQALSRGVVLIGPVDGFNREAWVAPEVLGDHAGGSWFRGACLRGDHLVVVGESQPWRRGGGLVFESLDGGATWRSAAPPTDAQAWHRCLILADGRLMLAGVNGAFAIRAR